MADEIHHHDDSSSSVLVIVLVVVGLIIAALVFMNYRGADTVDNDGGSIDFEGTVDLPDVTPTPEPAPAQ